MQKRLETQYMKYSWKENSAIYCFNFGWNVIVSSIEFKCCHKLPFVDIIDTVVHVLCFVLQPLKLHRRICNKIAACQSWKCGSHPSGTLWFVPSAIKIPLWSIQVDLLFKLISTIMIKLENKMCQIIRANYTGSLKWLLKTYGFPAENNLKSFYPTLVLEAITNGKLQFSEPKAPFTGWMTIVGRNHRFLGFLVRIAETKIDTWTKFLRFCDLLV